MLIPPPLYTLLVRPHGYAGEPSVQSRVHDAYRDKEIYFTECSGGGWSPDLGTNLHWMTKNLIIGTIRHWAKAVSLWNMALDQEGGPQNGGCPNCRGVVTINQQMGEITYYEYLFPADPHEQERDQESVYVFTSQHAAWFRQQGYSDGMVLVEALIEELRTQRIIAPALSTLECLAWETRRCAQQQVFTTLTASLLLRKLALYPRQNGVAWALREVGRLEKTLFTLEWLQSVELRRRVQLGLNKGEVRNALARAVFFYRHRRVQDRSHAQQ